MEANRSTTEVTQKASDCMDSSNEYEPSFIGGGMILPDKNRLCNIKVVPSNEFVIWADKDSLYGMYWRPAGHFRCNGDWVWRKD